MPDRYSSNVEYAANSFAKSMKGAAQVLQGDIGTRICYTQHGSFDGHTDGLALQEKLLSDISEGIYDFYSDMKEHDQSDDVLVFVFSEFGRRVRDNGNGTDHGSGGVAFLIGDGVQGGHYGEYPSLDEDKLLEGDLEFNLDFRGLYTEILEDWMEVDARSVVKGDYEKVGFLKGGFAPKVAVEPKVGHLNQKWQGLGLRVSPTDWGRLVLIDLDPRASNPQDGESE